MTEDEIIGRLRQIEQMAQRESSNARAYLSCIGNNWTLEIFRHDGQATSWFTFATAAAAFDAAERDLSGRCVLNDRAAIDAYVRAEEAVAPGVQDALLRLRSAVFAPAITGCPRVMEE